MFILNVNKLLDLTSFLPKLNYVFCALNRILMVHDRCAINKEINILIICIFISRFYYKELYFKLWWKRRFFIVGVSNWNIKVVIQRGIQLDVPRIVHPNVEEVVTLSMDPVSMGVLILTLSPLTALVRVLPEIEGFFTKHCLLIMKYWCFM